MALKLIAAYVRRFFRGAGNGLLEPGRRLKIRVYTAEDYATLRPGEHAEEIGRGFAAGPAYTVETPEGEVVFCCGLEPIYQHYGNLWLTLSPLVAKYPADSLLAFELLVRSMAEGSYLQTIVPLKAKGLGKALERLGFREHQVVKRPNGEDAALYVLIGEVANG